MPAPVKFVPGKDSLICYKHVYADMFYIKDGCRQKAKVKPLTAKLINFVLSCDCLVDSPGN